MARVILEDALAKAGVPAVVDSAGVSDEEHGNPMDPRAVQVLQEGGYAVPAHSARRVRTEDLVDNDLVLAMTWGHYRSLLRLAAAANLQDTSHIRMYRSFEPGMPKDLEGSPRELEISDPWYGGLEDFRETFDLLTRGAPHIVDYLATLPQARE